MEWNVQQEENASKLPKQARGASTVTRKILMIEDDDNIRDVCRRYLAREGYDILEADDGDDGWSKFQSESPHLVIVDLMLPGRDGYQLVSDIRKESEAAVIMLTARGEERDRLMGLTLGADDYMTKPFSPRELVLRVNNIFRRLSPNLPDDLSDPAAVLCFREMCINPETRRVVIGQKVIDLTVKEFDVLFTLARHPGMVFSKSRLLDLVWGFETETDTNVVTVLIRRLREKVEVNPSNPKWIKTVWGIGYRFESQGDGAS